MVFTIFKSPMQEGLLQSNFCVTFKNWPSIYLDKNVIEKDTCTPTFTAALFTVIKT